MGIFDLLKGIADQADFIPGLDPDKGKQGLLSQLLGMNQQPMNPSGTPPIMSQSGMNAVQKPSAQPSMPAPGGANPQQFAPPRPSDHMPSYNFIDMLNPFKDTVQMDRDGAASFKMAQERFDAQRAQQAAQAANQQFLQNAQAGGFEQDEIARMQMARNANPEEFGKSFADNFGFNTASEGSVYSQFGRGPEKVEKTFTPTDPAKLAIDQQNANASTLTAQASMHRAKNPSALVNVNTGDGLGGYSSLSQVPEGLPVPVELLGGYKPDTGFMAVRDSNAQGGFTMVPFDGGKVDRADTNRQLRAERAGGTVVQDIGRALELEAQEGLAGEMAVGPIAGLTKIIPGTPADRVDNLVQSALSNIGIDQLQAMRDASPTGGALGQIPVQQQARLEQMLGSLQVQQVDEDWRNNAKRAMNIYLDIIHGVGQGPPRADLDFDYLGRPIGARPEGLTTEEWFNMDPDDRELFE